MALTRIRTVMKQLDCSFQTLDACSLSSESPILHDIEKKLVEISELCTQLQGGRAVDEACVQARAVANTRSAPTEEPPNALLTPIVSGSPEASAIDADPPRPSPSNHLTTGRIAPGQRSPSNNASNKYAPRMSKLPTISCSLSEWRDFHCVLDRAHQLGAKTVGAFKVALDVSGLWSKRQSGAVRCVEYDVEQQANGVFGIKTTEARQQLRWSELPLEDLSTVLDKQTCRLKEGSSGLSGVLYRTDKKAGTKSQRSTVGLAAESILQPLQGNRLSETIRPIQGIHTPYFYQSGSAPGALFAMHIEDAKLYSVNILYEGRKIWIIVPPRAREQLEQRLLESNPGARPCSQFVRHLNVFVPVSTLEAWGIEFFVIDQRAGDAIITLENTYHQGFCVGSSAAEAVNYAPKDWDVHDYTFCSRGCPGPWIDAGLLTPCRSETPTEAVAASSRQKASSCVPATSPKPVVRRPLGSHGDHVQDAPKGLSCSSKHMCLLAGPEKRYHLALEGTVGIEQGEKARILQLIMQCSTPRSCEPTVTFKPSKTQELVLRILKKRQKMAMCGLSLQDDYIQLAAAFSKAEQRMEKESHDGALVRRRVAHDKKRSTRSTQGGEKKKPKRGKGTRTLAIELVMGNPRPMSNSEFLRCVEWGRSLTALRAELGPRCLRTFPTTTCNELAARFTAGRLHFPDLSKPIIPDE